MRGFADAGAAPAVHIIATQDPGRSHLGGSPRLPAGVHWPEWRGRKLAFLARISLQEVHRSHPTEWLPKEGALLFFYDVVDQPWGFDPQDRGGCRVLHVADLAVDGEEAESFADEFYPRMPVAFRTIRTPPSAERADVYALEPTEEEVEYYWEICHEPYHGAPKHQLGGYPFPVQGDCMELECQLVTNGLYCGDSSGYKDPRAEALAPGAVEWRLLLQLDTDADADVMWGDCGSLYFWVRSQEAAEGRFENTWLILQCS